MGSSDRQRGLPVRGSLWEEVVEVRRDVTRLEQSSLAGGEYTATFPAGRRLQTANKIT